MHSELFGNDQKSKGKLDTIKSEAASILDRYESMLHQIQSQNMQNKEESGIEVLLKISQDDLELYVQIISLPAVINSMISQGMLAQATKAIC